MLQKETITDNSIENFILLNPTAPQLLTFSKEESWAIEGREHNYTIPGFNKNTVDITTEFNETKATSGKNATNSPWTATDYIGMTLKNYPCNINEVYADFKLVSLVTNDFTALVSSPINSTLIDVYPISDTNNKLANIAVGSQLMRLPAEILQDINQDPIVNNYGNYILNITPKYVEVEVLSLSSRNHKKYSALTTTQDYRRQFITFANAPFTGTVWNFEAQDKQQGRLYGSIVEVWSGDLTTRRKVAVVNENTFDFSSGTGELVLGPDLVGYDSINEVVLVTDKLRIYPRETYFNPISILLTFEDYSKSLSSAIKFLKNDAVRDIVSGVIEIYDDAGVDENGDGTVIESFQVSQENQKEVRRKINIS